MNQPSRFDRAKQILAKLGFTDVESIVALRIGVRVAMQEDKNGLHYDCLCPHEKPIADRLLKAGVLEFRGGGKDLFLTPNKFQLN